MFPCLERQVNKAIFFIHCQTHVYPDLARLGKVGQRIQTYHIEAYLDLFALACFARLDEKHTILVDLLATKFLGMFGSFAGYCSA